MKTFISFLFCLSIALAWGDDIEEPKYKPRESYAVDAGSYYEQSGKNAVTEKVHKKNFDAFDINKDGFVDAQ